MRHPKPQENEMKNRTVTAVERQLNSALAALQDAETMAAGDWLLLKSIERAKDAVHTAMASVPNDEYVKLMPTK
jgi:hypothetical protein